MIRSSLLVATALVVVALPVAAHADVAADRAALLNGIETLDRPGAPGNLVVFGDDAFAVVTGGKQAEPVIAAARAKRGRVVAMAHSGYLDAGALARSGDSRGALLRNALTWAGNRKEARIGIVGSDGRLATALTTLGHEVTDGIAVDALDDLDLLVWKNGAGDAATADAVVTFVEKGGGLISAACPWGWAQIRAKRGLTVRDDLPENLALRRFGLVYADGIVDATRNGAYAIELSRPEAAHAGDALAAIVAGKKGAHTGAYLVEQALRALPADDDRFLPRVEKILRKAGDVGPAPGSPVRRKDALARLAVTVASLRWKDQPVDEIEPAPGADRFPGAVPARAERVTEELRLNPDVVGWQGTGLYLAPGDVLEFRVTTTATGETSTATGWTVRIGCHSDRLWRKDKWDRWPEITHTVPLAPDTTRVATPWGGTVFLVAGAGARPLTVQAKGAVRAPRYVLGDEASAAAWNESRNAPGPWTELEGRHIVLSVPSSAIRDLDDPAPILEYWDETMVHQCHLAGIPMLQRRERFVPDAQISAGYMHSGYPIMMHLDVVTAPADKAPPMLDVERLRKRGSWGHFHELGHNRQRRWWTFVGTGEVTNNLFSLYCGEKMAGIEPWENPWLQNQKRHLAPYLAKGAPFAEWRKKPGLALLLFAQMQREFGWEPFRKLFTDYELMPEAHLPKTDQQEIDGWVRGMSLLTGKDLRAFWKRWGAPLSPDLERDEALSDLPEWMPDFEDL